MAMLDRVVVDVVQVPREVVLVANSMFPVAPLPDRTFAFAASRCADRVVAVRRCPAELPLDQHPAFGEVAVPVWKLPDAVQVIRKYDHGGNFERVRRANGAKCRSQSGDFLLPAQNGLAVESDKREEVAVASVVAAIAHESWEG